jgi:Cu/Ag efflux protein CusF
MICSSIRRGLSGQLAPVVLAVALVTVAHGCRDDSGSRSGDDAAGAGARRYTVRGEIVRLPAAPSGSARQVAIRHEPLHDFVNEAGAVVGMNSMVMQFEVAPEVALDDVRLGDKVEVRLAIAWSPPLLRIEQLRKLPADTVLVFGEARPKTGGSR